MIMNNTPIDTTLDLVQTKNLSASDYVEELCNFASRHNAVNHSYLHKVENGLFNNMIGVLQEYAFQYSFYSKDFTNYLSGVIGCLKLEKHKKLLLENLSEENGDVHDFDGLKPEILAEIENVPHSELFNWFKQAIGVNDEYRKQNSPIPAVIEYRENFKKLCYADQATGIGAIGISTENIVPKVYSHFLEAIRKYTHLSERDRVFFDLHGTADVKHSEQIKSIAIELCEDLNNREKMLYGVQEALKLREGFWDGLYHREVLKGNLQSERH